MSVANYKLFCNAHNKFFYSYSNSGPPTECPITSSHPIGRVVELFNTFDDFNETSAPTNINDIREGYGVGSRWIDTVNNKTYVCSNNTESGAVWDLDVTSASLPGFLTSFTGTVNASGVQTINGTVEISNIAPNPGEVLIANDASGASWQILSDFPDPVVFYSGLDLNGDFKAEIPMFEAYVTDNTQASQNVGVDPVKVDATDIKVTHQSSFNIDTGATGAGRITYIGNRPRMVHMGATLSAKTTGNNSREVIFFIQQNGVDTGGFEIPGSRTRMELISKSNGAYQSTAIHTMPMLQNGDYVELYMILNAGSITEIDVKDFNIFGICSPNVVTM